MEKKDIEIIEKFLLQEENCLFSEETVLLDTEKGASLVEMLVKLLESERVDREKDTAEYGDEHRGWLEKKKKEINDEKYTEAYFADVRKYYVLYEMYKYKVDILKEKLESRVIYKQYGKCSGELGEYYCHSPILEIIVANVKLVGLQKKRPENMTDKAEYEYDENGKLIIGRSYWKEERLYSCEFLLYAEEWLMNLYYDVYGNAVNYITLRRYEREFISEYERASLVYSSHSLEGVCARMNKESYKYSEKGILENVVAEEYNFPILKANGENLPGILRRAKLSFECDEEGITGFWIQEYFGDKPRHEPGYVKLSERIRKIAKKTRGRWRRPNYFVG